MHPKMFTFFKVLHWNEETPTTCESPLLQRISSGLETHASFQVSGLSVSQLRENKTDAFFDIRHWLIKNLLFKKNQSCGQRSVWDLQFFFSFFLIFFFSRFFRLSSYSLLLVSWLALNIINYMHEMLRPTEDKFMTNHYPTFRDTGTYSFFLFFFLTFFQAFFLFTLIGFVTCLEYHKLYARNAQAYGGQVYDKSLPYVPRYR